MRSLPKVVLTCLLATAFTTADSQAAERWSQFRGPLAEGLELTEALPEGEYGMTVAWTRDIGSGYSHVSIADGKAVTMYTSGDVDVVAALDVATGDEIWRYELGEKYAGPDPSTDGPLGTPTLSGDSVYALGPRGQLVALGFADGTEKWRRQLDEENSTPPHFGYSSSPVVFGDTVILATGGEGHAITAFDTATGKTRWATGDDSVKYQTPMLLNLDRSTVLVALTDKMLQGLEPKTGKILWQHQHTEGEGAQGSAHVTPVDGERFLVKYNRGAKLYQVKNNTVEELWETNSFGRTYALPVRVDDHFYGFSGNFLTAVRLDDGEVTWRSRPPGGLGLSLIDGTLAIVARNGDLVLVDPSPAGYKELKRVPALETADYAVPSFADNTFIIRNQQQIAAVRIDASTLPQAAKMETVKRDQTPKAGAFGQWITTLEAMPEPQRQAAVDARFAKIETTPIVEGKLAHFVWRGQAEDVGLNGDPVDRGEPTGLRRIAGTDLFFTSLELDPKAQYEYSFTADFGSSAPDPLNPHSIDNGRSVGSELRMPEWPAAPHLEEPAEDAPRGSLDTFQFRSEILENTRDIQIWRPADYGQNPEARYPVLVVNHGDLQLRSGLMQNTLDNLVGTSVAPLIAVFVPQGEYAEYHSAEMDNYNRFLITELLPHIDRHYLTDGEHRAIMGPGSAGVTAIYAAVQNPEVFQKAATQGYYPIPPTPERLPKMIPEAAKKLEHVYVVWSRHEYTSPPSRRADDASKALVELLQGSGVNVTEHIANYSPGFGGWRGQDDDILAALFPYEAQSEE